MPIPSRPSPDTEPKLDPDDIVELGDDDVVLLEDDGDDIDIRVEPVGAAISALDAHDRPRAATRAPKPHRLGRHVRSLAAVAGGAFLGAAAVLLVTARTGGPWPAGSRPEAAAARPTKTPVSSPIVESVASPARERPPPPHAARAASVTAERAASAIAPVAEAEAAPGVVGETQPSVAADPVPAVDTEAGSTAAAEAEPRKAPVHPPRNAVADAPNVTSEAAPTAPPEAPTRATMEAEPSAERANEAKPPALAVHPARTRVEGSTARPARLSARIEPAPTAPMAPGARAPASAPARSVSDASASGAAAPPSPAPAAGELPMLPSRAALRVALTSVTPALRACTSHRGSAMMTLTLHGDGSVRSAAPVGSWGGDVDRACLERAVSQVRVPAFVRPSFTLRFPFVL